MCLFFHGTVPLHFFVIFKVGFSLFIVFKLFWAPQLYASALSSNGIAAIERVKIPLIVVLLVSSCALVYICFVLKEPFPHPFFFFLKYFFSPYLFKYNRSVYWYSWLDLLDKTFPLGSYFPPLTTWQYFQLSCVYHSYFWLQNSTERTSAWWYPLRFFLFFNLASFSLIVHIIFTCWPTYWVYSHDFHGIV